VAAGLADHRESHGRWPLRCCRPVIAGPGRASRLDGTQPKRYARDPRLSAGIRSKLARQPLAVCNGHRSSPLRLGPPVLGRQHSTGLSHHLA
jgi:hypothetical protein